MGFFNRNNSNKFSGTTDLSWTDYIDETEIELRTFAKELPDTYTGSTFIGNGLIYALYDGGLIFLSGVRERFKVLNKGRVIWYTLGTGANKVIVIHTQDFVNSFALTENNEKAKWIRWLKKHYPNGEQKY
jgi:hypothetical protein